MSDPLFLGEAAAVAGAVVGSMVGLRGAEGRHAAGVVRLRVGEGLRIGDGAGRVLHCEVAAVTGRDSLDARVLAVCDDPLPALWVSVVQALPKGDRGELAVELLTEVGVDEIVPWQSARAITRWDAERSARGLTKWQNTAVAAGKQSRRPRFPQVTPLASTADVAARVAAADLALVLHEEAAQPITTVRWPVGGHLVLVVGPEGGLSEDEVALLGGVGGIPVRLGPWVLRTSTAGAVAAGLAMAGCGRW